MLIPQCQNFKIVNVKYPRVLCILLASIFSLLVPMLNTSLRELLFLPEPL